MSRYLDLLSKCLTGVLHGDPPIDPWTGNVEMVGEARVVSPGAYDAGRRALGKDWPATAETMVGLARLHNLEDLIERIDRERIPGDLLEAGVWRGGACIFMRAVLAELAIPDRRVFVCDSFEGLPAASHPEDEGDIHHAFSALAVSLEEVRGNFARYGLLDDRVVFVKGLFSATMPFIAEAGGPLSLLRLDGDMYGSTMDVLTALYPKVSPGGFVVVDDYVLPAVQEAIANYLWTIGIESIACIPIDGTGIYWRKP